jgi:tRNA G18 (ribose-2'-O)-methylase SpoU
MPNSFDLNSLSEPTGKHPLLLILDQIKDPGNLGTLLRTAAAFDWSCVYITPNSVDPFNDKAIRAARGATFRVPLIYDTSMQDVKTFLQANKWKTLLADMNGKNISEWIPQKQIFRGIHFKMRGLIYNRGRSYFGIRVSRRFKQTLGVFRTN